MSTNFRKLLNINFMKLLSAVLKSVNAKREMDERTNMMKVIYASL
jgi:hypothetical protein